MFYLMTDEEIAAKNKIVAEAYASTDLEDKICALLMDMKVGSTGLNEGLARTKAVAIMELLEKGDLLK